MDTETPRRHDSTAEDAQTDDLRGSDVEWRSVGGWRTGPLDETWAAILGGGWIGALAIFFMTTPAPPEGQPPPPLEPLDIVGFAMLGTLLATTALAARRSRHTPTFAIVTGGLALFGQLGCAALNHAPVTAGWFVLQTAVITVMAGVSTWAYLNRHQILSD